MIFCSNPSTPESISRCQISYIHLIISTCQWQSITQTIGDLLFIGTRQINSSRIWIYKFHCLVLWNSLEIVIYNCQPALGTKHFCFWLPFVYTVRPEQNCWSFADDFFKYFFLNENVWIFHSWSLFQSSYQQYVSLIRILAWHWSTDKLLPEPVVTTLTDTLWVSLEHNWSTHC